MATKRITLKGTAKWPKLLTPDEKYNKYGLDLSLDEESLELFKKSGLQLKLKENNTISLRRPVRTLFGAEVKEWGPPEVVFPSDADKDKLIGNGSKVTCEVSVYDTVKGKGHRLNKVIVDELKEYVPNEKNPVDPKIDLQ